MANNKRNKKGKPFHSGNRKDKDYRSKGRDASRDRSSYKSDDKRSREDSEARDNRGFSNDPAWWMKAGQLSKDTASISTLQPVGYEGPAIEKGRQHYTPAGIARYDYIPYFGRINSAIHPINVAAKLMYDTINSKNSRNTAYDPNDLMIYVMAVANVWALHSWTLRIVGMFNTFSVLNRYWWTPVATSMGIAPNSTANDIIKWRNLANRMALKLNMLSVPNSIAYFARTVFMPSAFYADSPSQKASIYYFNPYALLKYDYDNDGLSYLREAKTPWADASNVTPESVENYFNTLTVNLFNDTDINLMGADIVKAYGMENCFRLPQVSEDYSIMFQYDPVVNLQIHNAIVLPSMRNAVGVNGYTITQEMNSNALLADWKPTLYGNTNADTWRFGPGIEDVFIPLDFPVDEVSPEMVVEATRLTPVVEPSGYVSACTEVLVRDRFYVYEVGEAAGSWELHTYESCVNIGIPNDPTTLDWPVISSALGCITKFHDAPITYTVQANTPDGYITSQDVRMISDVTNFTTVSRETLRTMHNTCILSIFSPNGV